MRRASALVVFIAVLSVGATGVAPAAGGAGDGPGIDIDIFGLDVVSIDATSATPPGSDCYNQARCESVQVILRSGPCDYRGVCQVVTYDVTPSYDGWQRCVKGDANTPGTIQAPPGGGSARLSVTVTGGPFTECGYRDSQMRWRITARPPFAAEGFVALRLAPLGDARPECGPALMQPWQCTATRGAGAAATAGWAGR
jgi:hypothetical protein